MTREQINYKRVSPYRLDIIVTIHGTEKEVDFVQEKIFPRVGDLYEDDLIARIKEIEHEYNR